MLTAAKNGFSTFVVSPHAITPKVDVHFKCNRDSGANYTANRVENNFYLGKISPGNTLSVTVVTEGFKSITRLIPHEDDGICFRGHYLPGSELVSKNAVAGYFVKLASLDGKMWHVIESDGEWIKGGLDGND